MTDPTDVHPEYDRPTPENRSEWTDQQLSEWGAAQEEKLEQEGRENRIELSEDQQEALDALADPEREDTAEVELADETLTVKTYMEGRVERKWQRVQNHQDDPEAVVDTIAEVMAWMVETDGYDDRDLWLAYREKYGMQRLMLAFTRVLEPYVEMVEEDQVVQRFRQRT